MDGEKTKELLSVIAPCYNEETVIERFQREVQAELEILDKNK